jgi:putative transposase
MVGIDMGLKALITTSAGEQVHHPHWYRQAQAELRRKQRNLQPAHKGSHQPQKKLVDLQRQHEQVKKQRKDCFDKLVYALVHSYDVIVLEDLKIKHMLKNRQLSKRILDSAWGFLGGTQDILSLS